ncbi:MAG: hypothetical protein V3V20_06080 [Algisphaera sp.]
MKIAILILVGLGFMLHVAGLMLMEVALGGVVFFTPFVCGPLVCIGILAFRWQCRSARVVLILGAFIYICWMSLIYADLVWHVLSPSDAQKALALLFVGFYALPVLLPVYFIGRKFEKSLATSVLDAKNIAEEGESSSAALS